MSNANTIDWLLSGDPAIRWQVMRDLLGTDENEVIAERKKVAAEGWGLKLLSCQDEDGKWSGQLYNGKWISTTYTLLLLKELGILPGNENITKGCAQLFTNGIYNDEEIRFSNKQMLRDNAVTGFVLGILCYFDYPDDRIHKIAEFLGKNQNENGSWHYDNKIGAEKYCFEVTTVILKGLLEYEKRFPTQNNALIEAQKRGQEFLLRHNLFKRMENDEIINAKWLLFSYPNYWFYDILVALDYFRECNNKDWRLEDAIDIMLKKQNRDGTWNLQNKHSGKTFFDMEEVGRPSRWNTLRCLRVIDWWNQSDNV